MTTFSQSQSPLHPVSQAPSNTLIISLTISHISLGKVNMPCTAAQIMAGTVENQTAEAEIAHEQTSWQAIADLPADIRARGDELFQHVLFTECPDALVALQAGTSETERPIVVILRRVKWQIGDLKRDWERRKAEVEKQQQQQQGDGDVQMTDADEQAAGPASSSAVIATEPSTEMRGRKRSHSSLAEKADVAVQIVQAQLPLRDSSQHEDSMALDPELDPGFGAFRARQPNIFTPRVESPNDVPPSKKQYVDFSTISPPPRKKARVINPRLFPRVPMNKTQQEFMRAGRAVSLIFTYLHIHICTPKIVWNDR